MEIDAPEVAAATGAAQHWTDIVHSVWPQQFEALFDAAAHEAELVAKWCDSFGRKAEAAEIRRVWAGNVQGVRRPVGRRMRALAQTPVNDRRDAALHLADDLDKVARGLRRRVQARRSQQAPAADEGLANAHDVLAVQFGAWATYIREQYSFSGDHHWTDELVVLAGDFERLYNEIHFDLTAALNAIRAQRGDYGPTSMIIDLEDDSAGSTPQPHVQKIVTAMRAITDGDLDSRDAAAKAIADDLAVLWGVLPGIVGELMPWTASPIDDADITRGRAMAERVRTFGGEAVLWLYNFIAGWLPDGELDPLT